MRYSTFQSFQLLATFTRPPHCCDWLVPGPQEITATAEAFFFSLRDDDNIPTGVLITDRSGTTIAKHDVAWRQGTVSEVHFSSTGSLMFPSDDISTLFVCSATGALQSIRLLERPSLHRNRSALCSSWENVGTVLFGPRTELQCIDLMSGQVSGSSFALDDSTLRGTDRSELYTTQGRRSLALIMEEAEAGIMVLSTSHGGVLFKLSGQQACWDALGDHLAVLSPSGTAVSVHDGLTGACLATWDKQPVPRAFNEVAGICWLPDGAALMFWVRISPDNEAGVEACIDPASAEKCSLNDEILYLRLSFDS